MLQDIYILEENEELRKKLKNLFTNDDVEYEFKDFKINQLDDILLDIPTMIIIDEDYVKENILEVCTKIRENEDNSITPIIVVSSIWDLNHSVDILSKSVQYYINKPIDDRYLYNIVKNMIQLIYLNRRISPLTGLPGNVQIQTEMKRRLLKKEVFAILYFDLDNFKAYNDVYGFSNGDEIIKFTARIICKNIHKLSDSESFIGHVGGDDFVAIISKTDYDKLCQDMILEFDTQVPSFYTQEDVDRGFVEVANRRGIIEQFPIVSLSISVVEVDKERYKNTLEIGEVSAQVKHQAKSIMGSTYVINKRKF
ncbi:MAG: diguanylate cyclase [Clostridia bacterium]|nr:diguanylate cyclase [Clostridia bacterium]